jgi:hypothetical protein
MSKTLTLVWHFYKPLLVCNLVFSIICIYDLSHTGLWFIPNTIGIKIVGYGVTVLYKHYFSNKSYIYFLNAGYSIKKMYSYVFAIDFVIYLAMVVCLYITNLIFAA